MNEKRKKRAAVPPANNRMIREVFKKANVSLFPRLSQFKSYWWNLPSLHRKGVIALAITLGALLVFPWGEPSQSSEDARQQNVFEPLAPEYQLEWTDIVVARGDTVSGIFNQHNLSPNALYAILAVEGVDKPLSRIKPGQVLRYKRDLDQNLESLEIEMPNGSVAMFFRLADGRFARRQ